MTSATWGYVASSAPISNLLVTVMSQSSVQVATVLMATMVCESIKVMSHLSMEISPLTAQEKAVEQRTMALP